MRIEKTIDARRTSKNFEADDAFIKRAIDGANLNALRMAIYQQTGDRRLENLEIDENGLRGGALIGYEMSKSTSALIKKIAFDYLKSRPHTPVPLPARETTRRHMEMFVGRELSEKEFRYGYEVLAVEDAPRDAKWSKERPREKAEACDVVIIGAGINGLSLGVQLNRLGIPYRIYDKQAGIGGTWEINDYPQLRVDISTFLYQFKFDKNYPWKSHYATRDELREYTHYIAEKYGVAPHITLNTEVIEAIWSESDKRWHIKRRDMDGNIVEESARVLISAVGLLAHAKLPDIPGIETYKGKMFHSTEWDHDFDMKGKSAALIGTGSTGCQLAPAVAQEAGHLSIYQRSAPWIMPVKGYHDFISPEMRWLFDTVPNYWNWMVYAAHVGEVPIQDLQVVDPEWVAKGGVVNAQNAGLRKTLIGYMELKLGDPELVKKCIPDYPPFARRPVMDNGYYETIVRDNVELVTSGIDQINATGILDKTGVQRDYDVIILSSGYHVSKYLWPIRYEGREGATPQQLWAKDGARAYYGLTLPEFPNFFVLWGPNGMPRGGGFHDWAEIWSRYIAQLIIHMIENDQKSFVVKPDRFQDYNDRMDRENKKLLWESQGVGGYYVNEHGRSGVNMPWPMHDFYDMIREANPEDYIWGASS